MTTLQAFHNDKAIKAKYLDRVIGHQKAADAVDLVRKELISRGFKVTTRANVSANGPDITAVKNEHGVTVEVKLAFFTSRAWKVKAAKRHHDDYLAIVFPNGAVHFEEMSLHQKNFGTKDRSVTRLARIYGN